MKCLGTGKIGLLLLGIWLILTSLLPFLHIAAAGMETVMAVLAPPE